MLPLLLFLYALLPLSVHAAGQPTHIGTGPGTWEIVGLTGVSAQQLYLGNENKVYIIDKTQNNAATINGHPAWAVEYDLNTNQYRTMDVVTNTFCAGGATLADGRLIVAGGNQPVTWGGEVTIPGGPDPYKDLDGGMALRFLTPCEDQTCNYSYGVMTDRRWYPTVETLPDGSVIIIGGDLTGGYVNNFYNNVPTYEFYPSRGAPQTLPFLLNTLPVNLYPLTWVLPSGRLFLQANRKTEFFDPNTGVETPLPDMPYAVRVYPASAATAMLPLTPANNYTATLLFCGGADIQDGQWLDPNFIIPTYPTSQSCVRMAPDVDPTWHDDDNLPLGLTMSNFIILPDATLFLCNGAALGTAGYGNQTWTKGDSYADVPAFQPWIYDPSRPAGTRFSNTGLSPSTVPRMYHSTATLLADGSVFVAGSSPHPDVVLGNTPYPTEYRAERFYPWYYQKPRPDPQGIPPSLTYGGPGFDIWLSAADMAQGGGVAATVTTAQVIVIRTGFATHAINFGQRFLQLRNTYTINADGSVNLHVSQLPGNAAIFPPGPAWVFVTVQGVPSVGQQVMIGSGVIAVQPVLPDAVLPPVRVRKRSVVARDLTSRAERSAISRWRETGVVSLVCALTAWAL